MRFTTDQQTLDDLQILGKRGGASVYALFNRTVTLGGARALEDMFRYPLSDAEAINRRAGLIRHLSSEGVSFPFRTELFDAAEHYLSDVDERTKLSSRERSLGERLTNAIGADIEYKAIQKGVSALLEMLQGLKAFIGRYPFRGFDAMALLLNDPALEPVFSAGNTLSYARIAGLDLLLRFQYRALVLDLLKHLYALDVYISVAKTALDRGFVFPTALSAETGALRLEGVYHPLLKNPISNSLTITPDNNVLFLTGANMAGKSTFMKTLGIALFLAHMGFPVPAAGMEFPVLDGIYTTINLPDNLGMGASHFYAEVLRVKKVAQELGRGRRLFIIFDELFRGTNVKDAYEATIVLTEAFARKRNSVFVVSTHIIEAAEILGQRCGNIRFVYLPTRMDGHLPVYTYTLEEGVTADRHGMVIIHNEGILDILRRK
jgi:DNA mismatch repair ATPase MutS